MRRSAFECSRYYISVIHSIFIIVCFSDPKMPHKEENSFQVVELHPTFAAEVHGIDFSQEISDELFAEIFKVVTKVS